MKHMNRKLKIATFVTIGICLFGLIVFVIYSQFQENKRLRKKVEEQERELMVRIAKETWDIEDEYFNDRITLDINGDGLPERVVNPTMSVGPDEEPKFDYLVALNYRNEEVGRTPERFGSPLYASQMLVHRLNVIEPKEYLAMIVPAGPHQTETMFLELVGSEILPVCKVEKQEKIEDCLFYNSRGGLIIDDVNSDTYMEVYEIADEYPQTETVELGSEIKKTIEEVFGEEAEFAKQIARQEQGGRGKPVIWGVYVFNGKYFEPQFGEDYDRYFDLLVEGETGIMKKSEMTKESVEYTETARDFWTHRK